MADLSGIEQIVRQVAAEFSAKNVTFMAAGIAYNAFVSLAPILLILLFVISLVGGGLEDRIVELANTSLPGPIADVVASVFEGEEGSASGASLVGIVVLIWGSLKIFRGLDTAFSEIYETTSENSLVDKLVDAAVVLVAIVLALVATVGLTAVFAALSDRVPFVGVLTPLILVAGLVIAFFPMYYRFPDTDVGWRSVLPGVLIAAVGWALFQALFQAYLSLTGGSSTSLFGGVIVVVTWLYFSGLVLLLGAVVNSVLGGFTSGKAGGVGHGATGYETEAERTLSPQEFLGYLEDLRESMAEGTDRPSDGNGASGRCPPPTGDVTVIEQAKTEEGDRHWAVSMRWPTVPHDQEDPSEAVTE